MLLFRKRVIQSRSTIFRPHKGRLSNTVLLKSIVVDPSKKQSIWCFILVHRVAEVEERLLTAERRFLELQHQNGHEQEAFRTS